MKKKKELIENKWMTKAPLYIDKKDKRYDKYVKQIKEKGFSDTETWCFFSVIAEFILPRLKRFKDITNGHPGDTTEEEWDVIIDKMIFAFEWSLEDGSMTDKYMDASTEERDANEEKYKEGMKLFVEYFRGLWW